MGVRIKVDAQAVSKSLLKSARNADNMRAAFEEVGEIVHASVMRNFEDEGRPKWQRMAPGGRSGKLLQDSSRLIRSIKPRATSRFAEVCTNVEYAPYHQIGTGSIPARPFIMLQDEDMPEIRAAILDHLKGDFE